MKAVNLTKADFLAKVANYEANPEWKFLGERPAIIDFYATWCGPCKMLAPVLEEIAEEYAGRVDVYKVNVMKKRSWLLFSESELCLLYFLFR